MGASAHVHAVTGIASSGTPSYSAAYDTAGDMTCRALASSSCDNPTPSGQSLSYDALRRLVSWQGTTSGDSEQYAYDGEGNRVWRQTTSGGTTTTTVSVLGVEDVTSVSGGQTTTTRYYALPGGVTATRDSSGLVYVASDQLGTPIAALNLSTGIVGEQLRAPYGQARYAANGTGSGGGMRTPFGFTGQREDTAPSGASGLYDFNARMYDSQTGRFTSADDAQPGLGDPSGQDNYAYVGGMVESATDPTGHWPPPEGFWNYIGEWIEATMSALAPHGPPNRFVPMGLPPDPPAYVWQQPATIGQEISQEARAVGDQIVVMAKNAMQGVNYVGQAIETQTDDATEGFTPDPQDPLRILKTENPEGTQPGTIDNEAGPPKTPASNPEPDNSSQPGSNPLDGDETGTTSPSTGQPGSSSSSSSTGPKPSTEPKPTEPDDRWIREQTEVLEEDEWIADPAPPTVNPVVPEDPSDLPGGINDPSGLPGQVGGGGGAGGSNGGGTSQEDSSIYSGVQLFGHWLW